MDGAGAGGRSAGAATAPAASRGQLGPCRAVHTPAPTPIASGLPAPGPAVLKCIAPHPNSPSVPGQSSRAAWPARPAAVHGSRVGTVGSSSSRCCTHTLAQHTAHSMPHCWLRHITQGTACCRQHAATQGAAQRRTFSLRSSSSLAARQHWRSASRSRVAQCVNTSSLRAAFVGAGAARWVPQVPGKQPASGGQRGMCGMCPWAAAAERHGMRAQGPSSSSSILHGPGEHQQLQQRLSQRVMVEGRQQPRLASAAAIGALHAAAAVPPCRRRAAVLGGACSEKGGRERQQPIA